MARDSEGEGVREGGEVMKNVSFLRLFDLCLINDEREKETGRKVTFYSRFFCTEECRSNVDIQLSGGIGGGEE